MADAGARPTRLTRLQETAQFGGDELTQRALQKDAEQPAGARVSARLASKTESLRRAYAGLVFSLVLHGHTSDEELKSKYATKFLHNIRSLLIDYPGCLVVLYYDESTSLAFLQALRPLSKLKKVHCVYFKQPTPSASIMFARFLELDRRPKGAAKLKLRPGERTWVFTFDGHEDLDNMPIKKGARKRKADFDEPSNIAQFRSLVRLCLESNGRYAGAALHWDEMDVT